MSDYFATYLPVKGEPKEGDHCTALYNDCIVQLGKNEIPWPGSKKVKLFLCSRNIQIGDTFIDCNLGEELTYEEIGSLNEGDFKIIGEISPEATWVKEGDEFDEEEVKWGMKSSSTFLLDLDSKFKHKCEFIRILGPCGHFH